MSVYESKNNKKAQLFQVVLSVFFIILCVICLIPIVHEMAVSFSSKEAILSGKVGLLPVGFTLQAYGRIFRDTSFMYSLGFTVVLTAVVTAIRMFVTILAAYPLSKRHLKGRGWIMTLFVLTMYFSPGMIPAYLNIKNLGLLNTVFALIVPGMLSAYNLIILRTFFMGIDESLYEAAYMDGCSEFKSLFEIAIPLSVPAIATLSLFYAVSRWNAVSDVLFYINDSRLFTVQLKLKQMIDSINIPPEELNGENVTLIAENVKAAAIMFSMLPIVIAYPFIQKYFTKGIMVGAVKG